MMNKAINNDVKRKYNNYNFYDCSFFWTIIFEFISIIKLKAKLSIIKNNI